jgi:hypothetical protein
VQHLPLEHACYPQEAQYKYGPVTKHYHKRTCKFGIEVPKSWDDCARLDKENDNTLWKYAVRKEIKNFIIAFKIINGEESFPQPTKRSVAI